MTLLGPDQYQLKFIQKDVNEYSDAKLQDNVKIIKDWLSCQPNLPKKYDERIIPNFLRGCKHDLERTKQKLDTYFTLRTTLPEFFQQRCPISREIVTAFGVMNAFPLPQLTPEGYRVTVHRFTNAPPTDFVCNHIYKSLCMIGDVRLIEESIIAGDIFVFDVEYMSMSHITRLANPQLKKILHCTQNAYPQRLKAIHIINAPSFIDRGVNMFKMFMKEKMRDRFHIHSHTNSLYNYIPQSILPEDYGGLGESIDTLQAQWLAKLESYSEWFAVQDNIKSNENLRPMKSYSYDKHQYFGYEGAFRQLNID